MLAFLHIFGRRLRRMQVENKAASHFKPEGPRFLINSGWMLSGPGALPHFMLCMACVIPVLLTSSHRLTSLCVLVVSWCTTLCTEMEYWRSGFLCLPFSTSRLAIAFVVTGTGLNCLAFPVRRFRTDQASRLEWVKSICSTESSRRFLRFSLIYEHREFAIVGWSDITAFWYFSSRFWHWSSQQGV